MCQCDNIQAQSTEAFAQMVVVEIPAHMEQYRNARVAAGLSGSICLDPCILKEIFDLWNQGIITYGSCCGHNTMESMVNVDPKDIDLMLELGYIQNHPDPLRRDTFRLKST